MTSNDLKSQVLNKIQQAKSGTNSTASHPFSYKPKFKCTNKQDFYSNLFMTPPRDLPDFPVTVFEKKDWDEQIQHCIPKQDMLYILPKIETYWAVAALEFNKRCCITGPPGTGKTALVRLLCAITKRPYIRIQGMEGLDPSDQIGGLQAEKGSTHYVLADAAIAAKYGATLAYDEPFKNGAANNMCFQALSEEDHPVLLLYGHPDFRQRHLIPHEEFRLFLCDNTKGIGDNLLKYAASEVQDSSFLNRMSYNLYLDYLAPDMEQKLLLTAFPAIQKIEAEAMVKLANLIRDGWAVDKVNFPYSSRNLLEWAKAYLFTGDIMEAFKATYNYYGEPDDIKGVLKDFWRDVAIFPRGLF